MGSWDQAELGAFARDHPALHEVSGDRLNLKISTG